MAYTAISTGNTAVADPPGRGRRPAGTSPTHVARDTRAHKPLLFRIRVQCIPHSRWGASPGAMPQGWSQYPPENPGAHTNPNSPHTPTWGDDDELAETEPSPLPPGDWNVEKGKGRRGGGQGK